MISPVTCGLFDGNRCCFAFLAGSGLVSRVMALCPAFVYVGIGIIFADIFGDNRLGPFGKGLVCYPVLLKNPAAVSCHSFRTLCNGPVVCRVPRTCGGRGWTSPSPVGNMRVGVVSVFKK